jgi:hypothetical protein
VPVPSELGVAKACLRRLSQRQAGGGHENDQRSDEQAIHGMSSPLVGAGL